MKIRIGFISNSSSSSFILIGCPLDNAIEEELKRQYPMTNKEKKDEDEGEYNWRDRVQSEIGLSILYVGSGYVIGKALADFSSDECLDGQEYSLKDLAITVEEVSRKLNRPDIKLLMGTRPC